MKRLTQNSTLGELWENPVGHDVLAKLLLQLGRSERWLNNPAVRRLTIGGACRMASGLLGKDFADRLLELVNGTGEPVAPGPGYPTGFDRDVFYQIYPRSFQDSNGDGIGDLEGIRSRLPYLQRLGVTALWLSPVYASPMDDNGYDISDYRAIHPDYGTMEDFDRLLAEVHRRGMKLIMDLVVNHTSDEHPWFLEAKRDRSSPYHDYYLWREGEADRPPNNWTSFFSGPAWNYYPEAGAWALHLFSKKQMDLNWENPALREEVADIVRWWLAKGVDGFRMDVINYIAKNSLEDGSEAVGRLMGYTGIEHYFYGHRLHGYLSELRREAFAPYGAVMIGETPGVGLEMAKQLTAQEREELDLVFNFDQLETPGHTRFDDYRYDLSYLKKYYLVWMQGIPDNCRMSLFWDNHDNPRMLGKIAPPTHLRAPLAKLLAALQLTLKGVPFLYQGQELGMTNHRFDSIDQLRDVESLNLYRELLPKLGPQAAFEKVLAGTRDYARTPMQWTGEMYAGFTTAQPWLQPSGDQGEGWNVEAEEEDPDSVLSHYRRLIALRRTHPALADGSFRQQFASRSELFCYTRAGSGARYLVLLNLSEKTVSLPRLPRNVRQLYDSYPAPFDRLRPYEAQIWQLTNKGREENG
ncbi:MAG TPA: alpha-glucosidase [Candidatus Pygmaiobacter gallistercoris]|nr:alpha-glucosidase [Candidatus Pygmaiobacter gallistercoris]